jgi:hypothetical protein
MAHYAYLDENNIVVDVITGRDEDDNTGGITDWEKYYGDLRGMKCKRTSYNSYGGFNRRTLDDGFRMNYAGVGFSYDELRDAFIPPKPYPSWDFNEESCLWVAPVEMPDDDHHYHWDEDSLQWVITAHD